MPRLNAKMGMFIVRVAIVASAPRLPPRDEPTKLNIVPVDAEIKFANDVGIGAGRLSLRSNVLSLRSVEFARSLRTPVSRDGFRVRILQLHFPPHLRGRFPVFSSIVAPSADAPEVHVIESGIPAAVDSETGLARRPYEKRQDDSGAEAFRILPPFRAEPIAIAVVPLLPSGRSLAVTDRIRKVDVYRRVVSEGSGDRNFHAPAAVPSIRLLPCFGFRREVQLPCRGWRHNGAPQALPGKYPTRMKVGNA